MLEQAILAAAELARTNLIGVCALVFLFFFLDSIPLLSFAVPTVTFAVGLGAAIAPAGLPLVLPVWAAASLGTFCGASIAFIVGWRNHDRVEALVGDPSRRAALQRAEAAFQDWGLWTVPAGRLFKASRALTPLAAGISRNPAMPFHLLNALSAPLWTALVLSYGVIFTTLVRAFY